VLTVPLPYGEVVDRIVILKLKCGRIPDPGRVQAARALLDTLQERWRAAGLPEVEGLPQYAELHAVNAELWEVEDALRQLEREQHFGERFVALARRVYQANDRRAALKSAIDTALGSPLSEPKWHPGSC
jgi:hypothetical protein